MTNERGSAGENQTSEERGDESARLRQTQLFHRVGRHVQDQIVRTGGNDHNADRKKHSTPLLRKNVPYRRRRRLDGKEFRCFVNVTADVEPDGSDKQSEDVGYPP